MSDELYLSRIGYIHRGSTVKRTDDSDAKAWLLGESWIKPLFGSKEGRWDLYNRLASGEEVYGSIRLDREVTVPVDGEWILYSGKDSGVEVSIETPVRTERL